jgi:hypothetical protein
MGYIELVKDCVKWGILTKTVMDLGPHKTYIYCADERN